MAMSANQRLPLQKPNVVTLAYLLFALAVIVLFVWGMVIAGNPRFY